MPEAHASLRGGASETVIERIEKELGRTLPDSLKAAYRRHDGQAMGRLRTAIFDSYRLMSLDEALEMRRMNTEVLEDVRREFPEAEPWVSAWLPFADDGLGNALVVDLERGEVFEWDHAEGRGEPLAASFEAYVSEFLRSLESGERVVDAELGVMQKQLQQAHAASKPSRSQAWLILLAIAVLAAVAAIALTIR